MRHAFLIARQEFVKYITRRGFFISILMFPVWIAIVILIPQWTGSVPQRVFTIVDRAGGYREAILDALARDDAARDLKALVLKRRWYAKGALCAHGRSTGSRSTNRSSPASRAFSSATFARRRAMNCSVLPSCASPTAACRSDIL